MDLRKWPIFTLVEEELLSTIKLACVFGSSGNEVLFITQNDEVYGMGPNISGCLGIGEREGSLQPKQVKVLNGKKVIGLDFGIGPHVVAFTEKGELYTWGHNGYCELGNGGGNQSVLPSPVAGPLANKKVIEVACGSSHNLALTSEGEVYAWGQNNSGQVGSGLTTNQSSPKIITMGIGGKFVKAVGCSQASSFAVLDSGEVYGWGYNGNGQLGVGNNANQLSPVKVSSLSGIIITKIICGHSHTLTLSDEGHLYAWGANGYGQLGTGGKTNSPFAVRAAKNVGRIVDIAATHYAHISAALTLNFKVYMWGQCKGQGIADPFETNLNSLDDVFAFFCHPSVTWKPVQPTYIQGPSLIDALKLTFDDGSCSDLTIMVQGQPIKVHKAILKIRCEHFRTMFQEHWTEKDTDVIEIDQYSYPVYKAFLRYLYTDEVLLSPEAALELLDLANAYCEERLKRKCEEIIKHGITIENTAMLYSTAIAFRAQELEEFCFKFTLNHMTAVVQSPGFMSLDETMVKNFVLKASHAGAFKT